MFYLVENSFPTVHPPRVPLFPTCNYSHVAHPLPSYSFSHPIFSPTCTFLILQFFPYTTIFCFGNMPTRVNYTYVGQTTTIRLLTIRQRKEVSVSGGSPLFSPVRDSFPTLHFPRVPLSPTNNFSQAAHLLSSCNFSYLVFFPTSTFPILQFLPYTTILDLPTRILDSITTFFPVEPTIGRHGTHVLEISTTVFCFENTPTCVSYTYVGQTNPIRLLTVRQRKQVSVSGGSPLFSPVEDSFPTVHPPRVPLFPTCNYSHAAHPLPSCSFSNPIFSPTCTFLISQFFKYTTILCFGNMPTRVSYTYVGQTTTIRLLTIDNVRR